MLDDNHERNDNKLNPIEDQPGFIERIDKRNLKPLNDPQCNHDWVDDDDEIGDMRAQVCRICPLGRWVKKSEASLDSA